MTVLLVALVALAPAASTAGTEVSVPTPTIPLAPMSADLIEVLDRAAHDEEIEVVVRMQAPVTLENLERATGLGLGVMKPLHHIPAFAVKGTAEALDTFLRSPDIAYAEWNRPIELMLDTANVAATAASVWDHVPGIGGPLTLGATVIDGSGVGIAIVDGGVDATHPDLALGSKTAGNWKYICGSPGLGHTGTDRCYANSVSNLFYRDNVGTPPDLDTCSEVASDPAANYFSAWIEAISTDSSSGHGTHVAGIAAGDGTASDGLFKGAAPGATLYGLGVGEGIALYGTLEAFDYILCIHDQVSPPIKVINNSWGSVNILNPCATASIGAGSSEALLNSLLVSAGVTIVYAAGNNGGSGSATCTSPQARQTLPGIVAVANYDDGARGTADGALSGSSSRGLASDKNTWPDVAAPGTFITAARANTAQFSYLPVFENSPEARDADYFQISGTSMAAPYASGVIALMLQANPTLTPDQVEHILEDSAYQFTAGAPYLADPNNPSSHTTSFDKGHGLVDARAAVQAAAAAGGATLTDTPPGGPLTGGLFYLSTGGAVGNVDGEYFGWTSTAPSKEAPSVWHDPAALTNRDAFWIPATILHGDVQLVNQDIHLRWWADALSNRAEELLIGHSLFEVTVQIGSQTFGPFTPTPSNGDDVPRQYDVVIPGVTASGNSIRVFWDSEFFDAGLTNALLYDSIHFPTSMGIGVPAAAASPLPAPPIPSAGTVCIVSRPTCYTTIQDAIDDAVAGEIVTAFGDLYQEAITIDKAITVTSVAGPFTTAIEAPFGANPVTITADGAEFSGFNVDSNGATSTTTYIDVQANNVVVDFNDALNIVGTGIGVSATASDPVADQSVLENNLISSWTGIYVTGDASVAIVGNLLQGGLRNIHVAPGSMPVTTTGNDFSQALLHVDGPANRIDAVQAFHQSDNTFDQAVLVSGLNLIHGTIGGAIADASAGDEVYVLAGTYNEPVHVPTGLDGLTLCATTGSPMCSGPAGTATIAHGQPLVVRSNDVTVKGFTLRSDAVPGTAVDVSGTTGVELTGNRIEAGPTDTPGMSLADLLPSVAASTPLASYLSNPFVDEALNSAALAAIREAHAGEPGLLAVVPSVEPEPHIALLYTGAAPAGVSDGIEEGFPVRVHEHVAAEELKAPVDPASLDIEMVSAGPEGPMVPGPAAGIGPGSHLLITDAAALGGQSWRCTASFIFKDPATGDLYLNTAGHCVLAGLDSSDDPLWQQPQRFRVCIANCIITSVNGGGGTYVDFEPNPVLYARQILAGQEFGEDFTFIKIPASLHHLVRSYEWFWGGPVGMASGAPIGAPLVHYGHGLGVGEAYPTEGRAAVGLGTLATGGANSFNALGWATGGDSGSAVLTADVRLDKMLFGELALGDLTHSIQVVGAPLFVGTRAEHAVAATAAETGVSLSLVTEEALGLPDVIPQVVAVAASGTTDLEITGNEIRLSGGGCAILSTDYCERPLHTTGIAAGSATGMEVVGNTISGEPLSTGDLSRIGGTNGILGGLANSEIKDNVLSGWTANGVFLWGADTEIQGNLIEESFGGVLLCNGADRVEVKENLFTVSDTGVLLCGDGGPQDVVLRFNTFDELLALGLQLNADTHDLVVDARLNQWSTDNHRLVEERINDEGTNNEVKFVPFLGSIEPPLPFIKDHDVYTNDATACNAHPDAFFSGGRCQFLTVQAAIDFANPGATVFVPESGNPEDPTPRPESILIDQNGAGADLNGLTVCSWLGGKLCASELEGGHWEWNGATPPTWEPSPGGRSGESLHVTDVGSTSLFPEDGFQIDDLSALSHDIFVESGACGGGSPRVALGLDTNGDGARDSNVLVYTTRSTSCPTGVWFHEDILNDAGVRWDASALGGPSSGSQADAHAAALAANPDYEVFAVNLQWDTAPASVWFDSLQVNNHLLAVAADAGCFWIDLCRWDQDTPRRTILDGSGAATTAEIRAADVTLQGFTLRNQGPGAITGLDTYGDGALVRDNIIEGNLPPLDLDFFGDQMGIRVLDGDDWQVVENTVRFWDNIGVLVANGNVGNGVVQDNLIEFNTNHGLYVGGGGSANLEVTGNTFGLHDDSAVRLDSSRNMVFRYNDFSGGRTSAFHDTGSHTTPVDARLNHWGIVGRDAIPGRMLFDGAEREIDFIPYLDAEGAEHPPFPSVYCFLGGLLTEVGETIDFQEAVDVDLATLDPACDTTQRSIVLAEDYESHNGAVIASEVAVLGNPTGFDLTGVNAVRLARIMGEAGAPGITFLPGSEGSLVNGVNFELREGGIGILADGLDPAGTSLEVDGNRFLASRLDTSTGVLAQNGAGPTVVGNRFAGDIQAVLFQDTTGGTIADNTGVLKLDGTSATAPLIGLLRADNAVLSGNNMNGNLYPGSIGIRIEDSNAPTVSDNAVLGSGTGIYVPSSTGGLFERNALILPPASQFGSQALGISLFQGTGHALSGNIFFGEGTGLVVGGATDVSSVEDAWIANLVGVDVRASTGLQPTGLSVNQGNLATTELPVQLGLGTVGLQVNAECNDWGAYNAALIASTRINDQGTLNAVDFDPWIGQEVDPEDALACLTPPQAAFSMSPNPAFRNVAVSFEDQSVEGSRPILAREWNFGDSSPPSTAENPTHSYSAMGQYPVKLTVRDTDGSQDTAVQVLDVVNRLPVFDPIPSPVSVLHGDTLTFEVNANDADGDSLSYSASSLPTNAGFDPSTRTFSWATTDGDVGLHPGVTFTVDDGFDQVDLVVAIDVVDNAPVLAPIGNKATKEEIALSFAASAVDPDGDAVTLSATGLPAGATFTDLGGGLGTFSWTPQVGDAGTYAVTFRADALSLSDEEVVQITVGELNVPPVVSAPSLVAGASGETLVITATGSDADGDPLTWRLVNSPGAPGSSFSSSGNTATLTWTIPSGHKQGTKLRFLASDGIDESFAESLVEIKLRPTGTPVSPLGPCSGTKVLAGVPATLRAFASDEDGTVVSVDVRPEGPSSTAIPASKVGAQWHAQHTYTSAGTYTMVVEVADDEGLTHTSSKTIEVFGNQGPSVDAGPDVLGDATGPSGLPVRLSGTASDPEGCALSSTSYLWTLPPSAGGGTLMGPTINRFFPLGDHTVLLTVTDPQGAATTDTVQVVVDDQIVATADMKGATKQGDVWIMDDRSYYLFGYQEGNVYVVDHEGLPVANAEVEGTVLYHGLALAGLGQEVGSFSGTTDANGVFEYSYEHDVLGMFGEMGLASMPGYHEIHFGVTADSRSDAPIQDDETRAFVLKYFIQPDPNK